jgi:putative chitobiose transport system permease protein
MGSNSEKWTVNKLTPYIFIAPAFALIGFFIILPMGQVVYYSLLDYSFFHDHRFAGIDNYIRLFADTNFWRTLLNSFVYTLVTPILMFISLVLSLAVRNLFRGAAAFRLIFFLPVITPIVIVGIMWRWIFTEETGMANYLLSLLSIDRVHWLTDYPTNIASTMILTVWRGMGYYMMLFLAGLALIPKEIEEASVLDGISYRQQVWHIILPMLRPTLVFIIVVSSASAIKIFTELYILIPGAPMTNKTLVSLLYQQAFERFDFGYGSAIGVVLFAITLSLSYVNIRLLERRSPV